MGAMVRAEDADLLLTNGNVYTVTEKQPKAEAIAVKTNRIVFVGSNDDAKKFHAPQLLIRPRWKLPESTRTPRVRLADKF